MAEAYDFVVVGSGPAACALVARLARQKKGSILMLEAGADLRTAETARVPKKWYTVLTGTGKYLFNALDWGYETYLKQHKRYEPVARGRTLGGSATVNAMMWVFGDARDWNSLEMPRWSWGKFFFFFSFSFLLFFLIR
jgi:choline dehydrogenase